MYVIRSGLRAHTAILLVQESYYCAENLLAYDIIVLHIDGILPEATQ